VRPSVTEVLENMHRILEDIVAPELTEAYPAHMLRGVLTNLHRLSESWDRVLPFLEWDNEASRLLLLEAAPLLDGDLATRIAECAGRQQDSAGSRPSESLEQRNVELRALLAEAIPRLAGNEPIAEACRAYLLERATRYPYEWTWVAPSGS
jgi:hypothetical protein